MRSRIVRSLALGLFTLAVAACNDDPGDGSSSSSPGTSAPANTTAAPTTAETSSTEPATTDVAAATTLDASGADADTIAEQKVQAALDALPDDWVGTIASDLGEEGDDGSDIVFAPCLQPDDYDLDQLDADSAASWELDAEGPSAGSPVGGQEASLEARVFSPEADLDAAFAVLEAVLGTDEGRVCLASAVPGQLTTDAPEDAQFDARVEGTSIPDADVGARLVVNFSAGGFSGEYFIDLAATRVDDRCVVFATYVSFGLPFDPVVAADTFAAAVAAGG